MLADGSHKIVELARFCITRRGGTVTPKLG
jgi:hypothetical protein